MHINKTKCQNTAKEIRIFHRKKIRDKDGNEEYTDDFVDVIDELYGKGWTNLQFIMNAEEYYGDLGHSMIIKADSAEPDRIDEWN